MGLMKKKIDNDLIVALSNFQEADYEKASPELQKLPLIVIEYILKSKKDRVN